MPTPVRDPAFLTRLEDVRSQLGLTLAALAGALGTHEATVYRWRRGAGYPSRAAVERLDAVSAVAEALARVYGAGSPAAVTFLATPHPAFDDASPRALLVGGQAALVLASLRVHGRGVRPTPAERARPTSEPPATRALAPDRRRGGGRADGLGHGVPVVRVGIDDAGGGAGGGAGGDLTDAAGAGATRRGDA